MLKRTKILTTLLILATAGASFLERHILHQTAGGWVGDVEQQGSLSVHQGWK